jgi:hypothetical protein
MISQFNLDRLLWFIVAILALTASIVGLVNSSVYDGVISESIEPGVFTQDVFVVIASAVLILLVFTGREFQLRKRVVAYGILGFLFYAYGIFCIERIYTWLYPIYLAIFGVSLFTLIYGMSTVPKGAVAGLKVRPSIRIIGAVYGILIAVMFNVIWFSQLVPILQEGKRIEFMYSIYIIDLSLVMPAFVIAAIMAIRRHHIGLMGIPALFVVGAGILGPLALAEAIKPIRYSMPSNMGDFLLYLILSVLFLIFASVFIAAIKTDSRT